MKLVARIGLLLLLVTLVTVPPSFAIPVCQPTCYSFCPGLLEFGPPEFYDTLVCNGCFASGMDWFCEETCAVYMDATGHECRLTLSIESYCDESGDC